MSLKTKVRLITAACIAVMILVLAVMITYLIGAFVWQVMKTVLLVLLGVGVLAGLYVWMRLRFRDQDGEETKDE